MSGGAFDDTNLFLVDNMDDASEFFRWAGQQHENDIIAFDTETEGLRPYSHQKVRLMQIGDTRNGFAFPPEWHGAALDLLQRWEGETVAHNAKFDVGFIRNNYPKLYKPDWRKIQDTLTMAQLDDSTRPAGLKPLTGMLISQEAEASQSVLDRELALNGWDWVTVPITRTGVGSSYWIYAALDPVLTARLYGLLKHVRTTYAKPYDIEIGALAALADMEQKGMRVDLVHSRKMIEQIEDYTGQIRAWIKEAYGVANPGSAQQLVECLQNLGREFTFFTDSGVPSAAKDQLQTFLIEGDGNLPGNDLVRQVLEMRKQEKQVGPYFRNFENLVDENDIVHPNVRPMGARTGRMSITDPALQTLPKGDPAVRDAFIVRDGHVMISIDADQIEARLAAHFSRDENLRTAFMEQPDFFNYVASQTWGRTITKADPERNLIKGGVYGKLYGAGNRKIAMTTGVALETIEVVMANFDAQFPGLSKLQDRVQRAAEQRTASEGRPYVITPMGRRLYGDADKEYALTNYLLQGHAAELLKQGLCDLVAVGLGPYMDLPVHDEVILEVPVDDLAEVKHVLEETLNNVGKDYFVPLTWGADVMYERWGDKVRKKG
ncbi:MAG: hypothetical protein JWR85_4058 [Marmoricola sp.]|nr:hypothetical protein [Marmoricola sp.]